MIITELELQDWCQHEHLHVTFSEKSNGIIGKNGAGKSNLVKAIRVALTGRTDKGSVLEDEIRDHALSATIILSFTHNGIGGCVRRSFYRSGSNRASLKYGEIDVNGITDTNKQLELLTGASNDMIEKFSFVGQDALRAILFDTPSKRLEQLISMIPTIAYTKLYRSRVDAFLKTIPEISLPYDEEYLTDKIHEYSESGIVLNSSLERAIEEETELTNTEKAFIQLISDHEAAIRMKSIEAERRNKLVEENTRLEKALMEMAQAEADLAKLQDLPDIDYEALKEGITEFDAFNRAEHDRWVQLAESLSPGYENAEAWLSLKKEELRVARQAETDASLLYSQAKNSSELAAVAFEWWCGLDETATLCPVCGTELSESELADQKAKDRLALDNASAKLVEAEAVLTRTKKELLEKEELVHQALETFNSWIASKTRVQTYNETVKLPMMDEEAYNKAKISLNAQAQLAISQKSYETSVTEVARIQERLALMSEPMVLSSYKEVSPEELQNAKTHLERLAAVRAEKESLIIRAIATSDELKKFNLMREEVEEAKKERAAVDEYRAQVTIVKDMLHRDQLPKLVLLHYLGTLRSKVSDYLSAFGASFTVNIDNDFDITFIKEGGVEKQLDRLSGGEKTVLSVSLHLAVSELFGHGLGLLALDEPTSNMDEDYLSQFTQIIETLSSGILGGDRQLVVVTHYISSMFGVFDKLTEV